MEKKVRLALIASGSGTDANSIMEACKSGVIPGEVEPVLLISTKREAGCLEKAARYGVPSEVMDYDDFKKSEIKPLLSFNFAVRDLLLISNIDLVFLVGCIKKIMPLSKYYSIYNIHPADPRRHGGNKMYGLAVHEHVLSEMRDLILRGRASLTDHFYTYPTVHEVTDEQYDAGAVLLQQAVQIPDQLVLDCMAQQREIKVIAEELQKHVLPYEWLMLPLAVRLAAKRILDKKGG